MFESSIYATRRKALAAAISGGLILVPGNDGSPIDFRANAYPFRQDGCFRYFFGVDQPGWVGLIDVDSGVEWLFADDPGIDGVIWYGPEPSVGDRAAAVGVVHTGSLSDLHEMLRVQRANGRLLRYPPPYRAEAVLMLSRLLDRPVRTVDAGASIALVTSIVQLREVKGPEEVREMTAALSVTREMHLAAMTATRPGRREHEVVGSVEGVARGANLHLAYQTIFTMHGEVLHNLRHDCILEAGALVVHDSGCVSSGGYASDITRTLPVSGSFDPLQRRLYDAVLGAQRNAIAACKPGRRFLDVHLLAARLMVEDLTDLGLFRGDPVKIVDSGAYALCFQCGLGHQIGLDVHDMEALGEDRVGYDEEVRRSPQFGLRSLRLGKPLKAGMTLTVEPGVYFVPAQIDRWRAERRHPDMIDYDRFDDFRLFGGIRIEDDILITAHGSEVLGEPIPKEADEIEETMARGRS